MADTKYCPRCSQQLAGPGACSRCGLTVGYGPGQAPPLDAPIFAPPQTEAPPPAPVEQTHADLPRIETRYRSPGSRPPDAASPQAPQPPRSRDRNVVILPMLGIVAVLALIAGGLWFLTNDGDDGDAETSQQQEPEQQQTPKSSEPSPEPERDPTTDGPLKVSAAYENQDCTGKLIIVLASSGDPKADDRTIGSAVEDAPDAKYLQTNKSCKTFNQSLNGNPIYAAYLGPFDSMSDACQARVASGVAASYVRMLSLDRELREICSCQDEASALPRLSTKTAGQPSYEIELRVYDLQSLLYLAGVNPSNIVTGTFGPETKQMVKSFQRQQRLAPDGWVGPQTWGRLLAQNCN